MKIKAAGRIIADSLFGQPVRETYWSAMDTLRAVARLSESKNRRFAGVAARDWRAYLLRSARPVAGETAERAQAAVEWLIRGQDASDDDGVSLGFFPCDDADGDWRRSYPETTGYIITSLLNYAEQFSDSRVRSAALAMAQWETEVQMESGAVQGGVVCTSDQQTPATFNTGMVLDGWCTALTTAASPAVEGSARHAADFLLSDQRDDGYFRTNGAFVKEDEIKTYNCLCGWALYRFGDIVDDDRYRNSAVRAAEAAVRQQQPNGWFANNCLTRSDAPLLHTIGYTLQGVLEVGLLARREDFIASVKLGVNPLLAAMNKHGYLPGRFYSDWQPAGFSSCLTGSAQLAIVMYRLFQHTHDKKYLAAADRVIDFLKSLQRDRTPIDGCNGALAGSFPIFGSYMQGGYPNWATKYLLDGLMLQHEIHT